MNHNFVDCQELTLHSGLKVTLVSRPGFHSFSCYVAIPVGSLLTDYEINNKKTPQGIAHFLEHRLFDTKKGDAFALFQKIGCDANAFTTYGYTTYYFDSSSNLLKGLKILLNMTSTLSFGEEKVEKEKPIIIEELKMGLDRPNSRLYKCLLNDLIINSPRKDEIVGSIEDINKTTLDDLKRVFNAFYSLDKMQLFIFGDLSHNLIEELEKIKLPKAKKGYQIKKTGLEEPKEIKCSYGETIMDVPLTIIGGGLKLLHVEEKLNINKTQHEVLNEVVSNMLFSDSSKLVQEMYHENIIETSLQGMISNCEDIDIMYLSTSGNNQEKIITKIKWFLTHLEDYINQDKLQTSIAYCYGNAILNLDSDDMPYYYVSRKMCGVDYLQMLNEYEKITMDLVYEYIKLWKDCALAIHVITKGE